jgi:hypothetical protein
MDSHAQAVNTGNVPSAGEHAIGRLHRHQRAWEVFGVDAVKMIPILQAQMSAVTQETERAAMELMVHLRVLAASNSDETSQDRTESISKIVMAMQFQDITRQKLEHVGQALAQLGNHLDVLLKGPDDAGTAQKLAALEQFEHQYTMEEERRLHQQTLAHDYGEPVPINLSEEGGDSVTLF